MNDALTSAIKSYSMQTHDEYSRLMHGFSKDMLLGVFTDLLTEYINDKNSSTLREFITVSVAGYQHRESKIGFNGYKHETSGKPIACEAKPKNVDSGDIEEKRRLGKNIRKLNGGGNFTDYTWDRFDKDHGEDLNMLVSGFVDGRLLYVLEFPFKEPKFTKKLREQLERKFPKRNRCPGDFLRSANFDYRHFIDSPQLRVVVLNQPLLKTHKELVSGGFYEKLIALSPS